MLILDATTKSLEIVLAGAVSTNQLPYVTSYVDITTSTFTPGASNGTSNDTTAVTIVAAPAASTQRQLKFLSVQNADTAVATVTVRLNHSATIRTIFKVALASGSNLCYSDTGGFYVVDSSGATTQTLGSMTSSQLAALISDETGSGALVFAASPTLSGTVGGALTFSGAITMSSTLTSGAHTINSPGDALAFNFTGRSGGQNESWIRFRANDGSTIQAGILADNQNSGSLYITTGASATTALTINGSQAATFAGAVTMSSTLAVTGDTTLTGDLAVNGGDLTTTAATFNLVNATATTVNFAGAATTLRLGASGGAIGFGGAAINFIRNYLTGNFTSGGGATTAALVGIDGVLTSAAGDSAKATALAVVPSGIVTPGAPVTIAAVSSLHIEEPIITKGVGDTITVAATLYIASAPTEGSTNAALYVASGSTYLQDTNIASTLTLTGTAANIALGSNFISNGGTDAGLSLNSSNNATLSGTLGVGIASAVSVGVYLGGAVLSGSVSQYGVFSQATYSSAATTRGVGVYSQVTTAVAAFTMTEAIGVQIDTPSKGAGSAITNVYGLKIADQSGGATLNYAIYTGAGAVRFGGLVTADAGISIPTGQNVTGAGTAAVTGFATVSATTLTGTLSTAAQGNVTSLGTLTSLTISGALTYGGVALSAAVTGTGSMVLSTSPVLVTPALGTPSSGTLTNCTGYPASGGASLVFLSSQSASASATIDFTSGITSTYDEYEIHLINVLPATDNASLLFYVSEDAGSSWKSAAGDYGYSLLTVYAGTTSNLHSTSATGGLPLATIGGTEGLSNTAGEGGVCGILRFFSPSNTSSRKYFYSDLAYTTGANGYMARAVGMHTYKGTTNAINGVRLQHGSGNITSGTFILYGIKKA